MQKIRGKNCRTVANPLRVAGRLHGFWTRLSGLHNYYALPTLWMQLLELPEVVNPGCAVSVTKLEAAETD